MSNLSQTTSNLDQGTPLAIHPRQTLTFLGRSCTRSCIWVVLLFEPFRIPFFGQDLNKKCDTAVLPSVAGTHWAKNGHVETSLGCGQTITCAELFFQYAQSSGNEGDVVLFPGNIPRSVVPQAKTATVSDHQLNYL